MNNIQILRDKIRAQFPDVELKEDEPEIKTGSRWLDIRSNGKTVVVEWRESRGFGVSLITPETGYGEGPDNVYPTTPEALERITVLLKS